MVDESETTGDAGGDQSPLSVASPTSAVTEKMMRAPSDLKSGASTPNSASSRLVSSVSEVRVLVKEILERAEEVPLSAEGVDALTTVWKISHDEVSRAALVQFNCVQPLLLLLQSPEDHARNYALAALCNLSVMETAQTAIQDCDGIKALVVCLENMRLELQDGAGNEGGGRRMDSIRAALRVLCNISIVDSNKDAIRECGGLDEIMGLLRANDVATRRDVLRVLCNLSLNPKNKDVLVSGGALENVLWCLSQDADLETKRYSLATLINFTSASSAPSSGKAGNDVYLGDLDVVQPTIECMRTVPDVETCTFAMRFLCNIAQEGKRREEIGRCGGMEETISCLHEEDLELRCYTLATLSHLCESEDLAAEAVQKGALRLILDCMKVWPVDAATQTPPLASLFQEKLNKEIRLLVGNEKNEESGSREQVDTSLFEASMQTIGFAQPTVQSLKKEFSSKLSHEISYTLEQRFEFNEAQKERELNDELQRLALLSLLTLCEKDHLREEAYAENAVEVVKGAYRASRLRVREVAVRVLALLAKENPNLKDMVTEWWSEISRDVQSLDRLKKEQAEYLRLQAEEKEMSVLEKEDNYLHSLREIEEELGNLVADQEELVTLRDSSEGVSLSNAKALEEERIVLKQQCDEYARLKAEQKVYDDKMEWERLERERKEREARKAEDAKAKAQERARQEGIRMEARKKKDLVAKMKEEQHQAEEADVQEADAESMAESDALGSEGEHAEGPPEEEELEASVAEDARPIEEVRTQHFMIETHAEKWASPEDVAEDGWPRQHYDPPRPLVVTAPREPLREVDGEIDYSAFPGYSVQGPPGTFHSPSNKRVYDQASTARATSRPSSAASSRDQKLSTLKDELEQARLNMNVVNERYTASLEQIRALSNIPLDTSAPDRAHVEFKVSPSPEPGGHQGRSFVSVRPTLSEGDDGAESPFPTRVRREIDRQLRANLRADIKSKEAIEPTRAQSDIAAAKKVLELQLEVARQVETNKKLESRLEEEKAARMASKRNAEILIATMKDLERDMKKLKSSDKGKQERINELEIGMKWRLEDVEAAQAAQEKLRQSVEASRQREAESHTRIHQLEKELAVKTLGGRDENFDIFLAWEKKQASKDGLEIADLKRALHEAETDVTNLKKQRDNQKSLADAREEELSRALGKIKQLQGRLARRDEEMDSVTGAIEPLLDNAADLRQVGSDSRGVYLNSLIKRLGDHVSSLKRDIKQAELDMLSLLSSQSGNYARSAAMQSAMMNSNSAEEVLMRLQEALADKMRQVGEREGILDGTVTTLATMHRRLSRANSSFSMARPVSASTRDPRPGTASSFYSQTLWEEDNGEDDTDVEHGVSHMGGSENVRCNNARPSTAMPASHHLVRQGTDKTRPVTAGIMRNPPRPPSGMGPSRVRPESAIGGHRTRFPDGSSQNKSKVSTEPSFVVSAPQRVGEVNHQSAGQMYHQTGDSKAIDPSRRPHTATTPGSRKPLAFTIEDGQNTNIKEVIEHERLAKATSIDGRPKSAAFIRGVSPRFSEHVFDNVVSKQTYYKVKPPTVPAPPLQSTVTPAEDFDMVKTVMSRYGY